MLKRLPYLHRPFPPSFSQCRFTETDSKTASFAEKILTSQALDPSREQDEKGVDFRMLKIYPEKRKKMDFLEKRKPVFFDKAVVETMPPRQLRMSVTQDWPSVWPTAHSFKASVVPINLRMGFLKDKQRKHRTPPKAYANLELMKIPNFLHLTPLAVKRHCLAIKSFCTKWPKGLTSDESIEKYFPIEFTCSDYIFAGPSVRDERSRRVQLKIKLSSLTLDERAKLKFIKLAGEFYDKATDTLTLTTDRCPARHQNKDYAMYLLTAMFHQSRAKEAWENEIPEVDRVNYKWDGTVSQKNVIQWLQLLKNAHDSFEANKAKDSQAAVDKKRQLGSFPKFVKDATKPAASLENVEEIREFKDIVEKYRNDGETDAIVKNYSSSVRKMLGLPSPL